METKFIENNIATEILSESFFNIIANFKLDDLFEIEWIGEETFFKTLELFSKNGYSCSYFIEVNYSELPPPKSPTALLEEASYI